MPPAKKRRTGATTGQSTLSFHPSKAGAATRASLKGDSVQQAPTTRSTKKLEASPAPSLPKVEDIELETEKDTQTQTQDVHGEVGPVTMVHDVDEEDEEDDEAEIDARALAVSESAIKAYWQGKERERKAPRVHQGSLGVREKVLREFDLSSRYGPSVGIGRLGRWRRAHGLGLEPPIEVLAVLLKEAKSGAGMDKGVMDDLIMASRGRADKVVEV